MATHPTHLTWERDHSVFTKTHYLYLLGLQINQLPTLLHLDVFWPKLQKQFAPLLSWLMKPLRNHLLPLFVHLPVNYQCPGNAKLKMVGPMSAWIFEWLCWMAMWNSPNPYCLSPPSYWFTKINEVTTMTLSHMPFLKDKHSTFYVQIWLYIFKTYPIVHIVL